MRLKEPFNLSRRSERGSFRFSLNLPSGLPAAVCNAWKRKQLSAIPLEIRQKFKEPKSERDARVLVLGFIAHLKEKYVRPVTDQTVTLEDWSRNFRRMDGNPRARTLLAEGHKYSPKTLVTYGNLLDNHVLKSPISKKKIAEITKADIEELIAGIVKKMGPCRTAEAVYSLVRLMFSEYRRANEDFKDPFVGMRKPKYTKRKTGMLTEEEVVTLFGEPNKFAGNLERFAFLLAYFCGLRRGEILALHHDQVDTENTVIHVTRGWKNMESKDRELGLPKWEKTRDVPLPDIVLREYEEIRKKKRGEMIFVYADGSPCLGTWWQKNFTAALKKAGIDPKGRKLIPHGGRKTLASLLYAKGVQMKYLQELLGHSDMEITDLVYVETPPDAIDKIGKKIDTIPMGGKT